MLTSSSSKQNASPNVNFNILAAAATYSSAFQKLKKTKLGNYSALQQMKGKVYNHLGNYVGYLNFQQKYMYYKQIRSSLSFELFQKSMRKCMGERIGTIHIAITLSSGRHSTLSLSKM
jgi:hypothetical protein